MDRSTFDHISDTLDKLYQKLEDSFSYNFSEDEINKFKKKIEDRSAKLDQMNDLNAILCDVHNEIVDLQNFRANHKPEEEEDKNEPKIQGLKKIEIPSVDTDSASSDSTSSSEAKSREKLPFAFLSSISNSAYTRYYTAYKEAKSIVQQLRKENPGEFIWELTTHKMTIQSPDAVTLFANLKEVYEEIDIIELTKIHGKQFVRFYKIFNKMLRIALTFAAKKK